MLHTNFSREVVTNRRLAPELAPSIRPGALAAGYSRSGNAEDLLSGLGHVVMILLPMGAPVRRSSTHYLHNQTAILRRNLFPLDIGEFLLASQFHCLSC